MTHVGENVTEFLFVVWTSFCLFLTLNQNDTDGVEIGQQLEIELVIRQVPPCQSV